MRRFASCGDFNTLALKPDVLEKHIAHFILRAESADFRLRQSIANDLDILEHDVSNGAPLAGSLLTQDLQPLVALWAALRAGLFRKYSNGQSALYSEKATFTASSLSQPSSTRMSSKRTLSTEPRS